ncbi:hypothetical protein D3C75_705490 [compost metagenome]
MRFAAVPLQLQLEFEGRFRWLIRQGNQLLTLGHQQAKGQGRRQAPLLFAALLPNVDNENAELFPASFHYQDKAIAIMQR